MYTIPPPSSAPVHSFGTNPGSGPPTFGVSGPAGPKSFTGGGVPLSAPRGDMGNSLTHKQTARVVVERSPHINDYANQSKTLTEKEFSVIQLNCRSELHAMAPPGDHAVISSLAMSNHVEMKRRSTKHDVPGCGGPQDENQDQHLKRVQYAPFGPVIQTDKEVKQRFGERKCVTNVAIGGRANFANCFIRTAGCSDHSPDAPVNVGDGVFMASFLFTCNNNAGGLPPELCAYRTFNFLIVDNDYSMVPKVPGFVLAKGGSQPASDALESIVQTCLDNPDSARKLCATLCCAFENPGVELQTVARREDRHLHIVCTMIQCVGSVIECPIPNAHSEHPQVVLNGMINNCAKMSTAHPVAVQMTS